MNGSKVRGYKQRTLSARIVIVIVNINAQGSCRSVVGAVLLDCRVDQLESFLVSMIQ